MKKTGKLNIVMLGHKRIPSREGGIEVVVEELSTRMIKKGHSVTCFNRSGHHVAGIEFDTAHLKEYEGVKLVNVFTINKRGLSAMTASVFGAIKAAIATYDVVHFHAEGPAFMCWLPKLFKKKVVVTVHGLDHKRTKWGKFARWYILCGEKNAVRFADEIIVLSSGVQAYFMQNYGRKTVYIPNGVQDKPNRLANQITQKWGIKKDGYILYMGRLVPEKGSHYLIEAFKGVKTDKKLVIAGGSSDTIEYIKKIQSLAEGDDRIIFTGFVQGRVKHELYSNAYVYTLPSDLEGMPLTVLEGMSYDNCCLVSSIDECTEVVEDKAVVFKKSDIADLREKLQMLCDDEELVQKYKSQSKKFIFDKYNWEDVINRTIELYRA